MPTLIALLLALAIIAVAFRHERRRRAEERRRARAERHAREAAEWAAMVDRSRS